MLGIRNGNIASGVEAGMQRASVVPSWTPRHNEAFRIGRRMTLLERQRRESFMKGMFIPFMLLALVCSLFGDTNILHADVQKVVVYDSGSALTDMQKQSPVILESFEECMETSASKAPLKHLVDGPLHAPAWACRLFRSAAVRAALCAHAPKVRLLGPASLFSRSPLLRVAVSGSSDPS